MKNVIIVLLATLSLITFSNCKKDNDDKPAQPKCRIVSATPDFGLPFSVAYNSDGKVAAITEDVNVFFRYSYSRDTTIVNISVGTAVYERHILVTGSNGMIAKRRREHNSAGTSWTEEAYEYNGVELIKKTVTKSSGGSPFVTTYKWSNGNLISESDSFNGTTEYEYYTDEPLREGDAMSIFHLRSTITESIDFRFTGSIDNLVRNKNLLKRRKQGGNGARFDYSFDEDGKIKLMVFGGTTIWNYKYECNF